METVGGEAPGCLKALPPPDLAIIGGNDGRLDEIFTAVTGALNPGGRVMVTAVLERTRKAAHDLFADSGLADRTVTRVAVARGDRARWNEHNPVLIFSGDRSGAEGDGRRRKKRKEKKREKLREVTGIDTEAWMSTMPPDVKGHTEQILESLGGEDAIETYTPVIKALHDLVPEYPLLHWRHLHEKVRDKVRTYYENKQFGEAASQGVLIFCEIIRNLTGRKEDGNDLVNRVFGSKPFTSSPEIQLNDLSTESLKNIQEGQSHLSRGVVTGFRNPISHGPIDTNVPALFSELDCLNILSLVSYLITRLNNAKVNNANEE